MARITGYTFKADHYCPEHLIEELIIQGLAAPAARDMDVEEVLDQVAAVNGIDREDEYSFDTDEFPKTIDSLSDDDCYCGTDGQKLG